MRFVQACNAKARRSIAIRAHTSKLVESQERVRKCQGLAGNVRFQNIEMQKRTHRWIPATPRRAGLSSARTGRKPPGPRTGRLSSARLHLFAKRTQKNPTKTPVPDSPMRKCHDLSWAIGLRNEPNTRTPLHRDAFSPVRYPRRCCGRQGIPMVAKQMQDNPPQQADRFAVTVEQYARFRRDGFLVIPQLVSQRRHRRAAPAHR